MTPEERVANYQKIFPDYPPVQIWNDQIFTMWEMGNTYGDRKSRGVKYYGKYPHGFEKRVLSLFPDCPYEDKIMHLFSGIIKTGTTFDIKPELNPTICDDVRNIKNYTNVVKKMDLIMADPPYDDSDFEEYGCEPFYKWDVIRDLATIMRPGSFLTWLDTWQPQYRKDVWIRMGLIGVIGVAVSGNHRYRCLALFQKR
jgi:hypothetical protein